MKYLIEKGAYPLIIAYLTAMNSRAIECFRAGKINLYFLLYVIYQTMHTINSKQKIPDKMAALNFKIGPSLKGQTIHTEIENVVDMLVGNRGEQGTQLVSNNDSMFVQLRQFSMVSEQEYKQAAAFFGDELKVKKRKDSLFNDMSMTHFKRESLNNSNVESSGGSKMWDDESFKDVLDKIH